MLKAHTDAIAAALQHCAVVATHSFHIVELSPNIGYVEGEALFVDGSRLVFFELLRRSGSSLDREKYRYHYMDKQDQLIFRYDSAPHHSTITTFPHHKHISTGVTESSAPAFTDVLMEVEKAILGMP